MEKSMKKMLKISGAAVTAASLTAYFTTKYFVNLALDRECPKAIRGTESWISGSRKNRDSTVAERARRASEKLALSPNETVTIVGRDGEALVGHFIPCENAERLVIAVHGWRSSWYRDFGMISEFWSRNRCSVLYIEQRGQNNSGGIYMGFGLTERYDCLEWCRWAAKRFGGELPIYLCGVSMGATTVLMSAGLPLPGAVHGIVADCGFTSPYDIWKHVAKKNLHIAYAPHGAIANALCKQKILVGARDYSTVEALKNTRVPVLLIHGTEDRFVPVSMTYENYLACRAPKDLLIVPGAGHAMSYLTEPERYERTVRAFWDQHDRKTPQ